MRDRKAQWALVPFGRVNTIGAGWRPVVTLDCTEALQVDPWLGLLLPTRDYNRELLFALDGATLPSDAIVGAFLAHPFLDMDRLLPAVAATGAAGIAAFPGISRLSTGFAGTAEQSGLALATEAQRLLLAADRGFTTMASVGAAGIGPPPPALQPDWVITVPRVAAAELPPVHHAVLDYRAGAGRDGVLPLPVRRGPGAASSG